MASLVAIFAGVLGGGLMSAPLLNKYSNSFPVDVWEFLHVLIFCVPVMLGCIITFVALEDDSPSMTIVRFVGQAGETGRSLSQVRSIVSNETLIIPRIRTMVKNGWIEYVDGKYHATAKGRICNQILALGPKLLNISREG